MRPQPLICVSDVERSGGWYRALPGCEGGHCGDEYERLVHHGRLVMQLHRFDVEHHHGRIGDPASRPNGNGLALWFELGDFDGAVRRAEALQAEVVRPPHRNPPDGPRRRPPRGLAGRPGWLSGGAGESGRRVALARSTCRLTAQRGRVVARRRLASLPPGRRRPWTQARPPGWNRAPVSGVLLAIPRA